MTLTRSSYQFGLAVNEVVGSRRCKCRGHANGCDHHCEQPVFEIVLERRKQPCCTGMLLAIDVTAVVGSK